MKEKIILIGGGGHCRACIEVIETEDRFTIAGIVDVKEKLHQKVSGYEIIATDDDLPKLVEDYRYFLITIGQIKDVYKRRGEFEYIKGLGARLPVLVSPLSYVSKNVVIGEGTIVMHKALVNANARIGRNCIINTGAIVEHDVRIENHCHISTGSIVNGGCRVKEGTLVGSNSVLVNNVNVAKNTVIGAGSVVVKPINESGIYAGNPARRRGENA